MTTSQPDPSSQTLADLVRRREMLVRRLDDGDRQIQRAARDGQSPLLWEDLWISLLREYEAVCREISERGGTLAVAA